MSQVKLVRDKVPELLQRETGVEPSIRVADAEEYRSRLRAKLIEEVEEFLESESPAELADILEVMSALADDLGVEWQQIEKMRSQKASERGVFTERLIWSTDAEPEPAD